MKEQPSQSSYRPDEISSHNPSPAPPSPLCLEVESLTFLDNGPYSFTVPLGDCVGLSGKSGIGKSQLLRAIADLIPHTGSVALYGEPMESVAPQEWRSRVLMVPAESSWWHDTVEPHFATGLDSELFNRAINMLGFDRDVLNWAVSRLSTGEKQRLALVRALVLQPQLLLLDEPSSGLDADHTGQLELLIRQIRQEHNTSVLWVSHDRAQLARVASIVLKIDKNSIAVQDVNTIHGEVAA